MLNFSQNHFCPFSTANPFSYTPHLTDADTIVVVVLFQHNEIVMLTLTATCINSSHKGPSSHKVLSVDEQKWWLGLDANQGVPHSTSYKP